MQYKYNTLEIVQAMRFWNNLHQLRHSKPNDWKDK